MTTVVNLPSFLNPPGSKFRWRMASDNSGSGEGWRVSIRSVSLCAKPWAMLPSLALRRHQAPCCPHHQALTLRPRLLRHLAQAHDTRLRREAGVSQNGAGGSRATSTGRSRDRVSRNERVKRGYINSLTSDFSSFNSATDASIFARLKSFIGTPCTISHFPPRTRTGNDEINPFSTS